MLKRNAIVLLALTWMSSGWTQALNPSITNYETPGNLVAKHPLACASVDKLKDTDTPPDLYAGLVDCAKHARYGDAVYFFALAGAYSYFDAERVVDETARDAHSVLTRNAMEQLDQPTKDAVFAELKATLGDPAKLPAACTAIERIGPPNYFPQYMVQHGMDAVNDKVKGNGLITDFDAKTAWDKALDNYLHCH